MGNESFVFHSCARLNISGGDGGMKCEDNLQINLPEKCSFSASLPLSYLMENTRAGKFCHGGPKKGKVSKEMTGVCDPRGFC